MSSTYIKLLKIIEQLPRDILLDCALDKIKKLSANTEPKSKDFLDFLNKYLLLACDLDDVYLLKSIIKDGATDLNGAMSRTSTANIELVKALIDNGANKLTEAMYNAGTRGDIKMAKFLIANGATPADCTEGIVGACEEEDILHMDFVLLMIAGGANDWNSGLLVACGAGHIDVVTLMIKYGANNFDEGLVLACYTGRLEIAKLMLKMGATNVDEGLSNACFKGYRDVAELMFEHGAKDSKDTFDGQMECEWMNDTPTARSVRSVRSVRSLQSVSEPKSKSKFSKKSVKMSDRYKDSRTKNEKKAEKIKFLNFYLTKACAVGDIKWLMYILDQGADDYNKALEAAIKYNSMEIVNRLLKIIPVKEVFLKAIVGNNYDIMVHCVKKGANNFNIGLEHACYYKSSLKIMDFLLANGASPNVGLYNACSNGYMEIVKMLIYRGATNLNRGLFGACANGQLSVAKFLIKKGANHFNEGLRVAITNKHPELVDLMKKHGAVIVR